MRYTAIFEPQPGGGYHATCPALPGCHSEGDTLEEADANIREAIAGYLESLRAHGETPPVEDILIKSLDVVMSPCARWHSHGEITRDSRATGHSYCGVAWVCF